MFTGRRQEAGEIKENNIGAGKTVLEKRSAKGQVEEGADRVTVKKGGPDLASLKREQKKQWQPSIPRPRGKI